MSNKEIVKDQVPETPAEEKKAIEVKTKKRIHFQNPFKVESIEVPAKVKKEKKAKEPKPEKPAKQKFGVGFAAGFAAGSILGAGAGFFGGRHASGTENDIPVDDIDDEIELTEDEELEEIDPVNETEEDKEEKPEE